MLGPVGQGAMNQVGVMGSHIARAQSELPGIGGADQGRVDLGAEPLARCRPSDSSYAAAWLALSPAVASPCHKQAGVANEAGALERQHAKRRWPTIEG